MRVLVCGGRDYKDKEAVFSALQAILKKHGRITVIQGGCPTGADFYAREFAASTKGIVYLITESADWERYGRSAGPRRNQAMLDKHKPDGIVAFPGNAGTADMVRRARKAGLKPWFPMGEL